MWTVDIKSRMDDQEKSSNFGQKLEELQSLQTAVQSIGCWCRKEEAQLNDPAANTEGGLEKDDLGLSLD